MMHSPSALARKVTKPAISSTVVYLSAPPRVEYELTELGQTMKPMLKAMSTGETSIKTFQMKIKNA
jgi:DNA-binding HxlR family transcriptional regulator